MSKSDKHHTTIGEVTLAWGDCHAGRSAQPPLVCLHGLGSSSADFSWLCELPAFSDRHVVQVDAAGHGESIAPSSWSYTMKAHADVIAAFIRTELSVPVNVVGHSMGGSIAIALASAFPKLISRLILAEPNLDPGTGLLSGFIARQSEQQFVRRGHAALIYQSERATQRGDAAAAAFLPSVRIASPVAMYRSAISLRAPRTPTFRDQLLSLKAPVTLAWGEHSPLPHLPLRTGAIRQIMIPDAGHQMMADNPSSFAAALHLALQD